MPFINGRPIDQLADIVVLREKRVPINQSDQLINGAQQILSDETHQDMEQNNDIKFYLIEENSLNGLNELSEESVEYNSLNSRRHTGN